MQMQADNWRLVKDIIREALRIDRSRRREFLAELDAPGEVRAEVESLLACEAESSDFMSLPITDFSRDFASNRDAEPETSLIG